MTQENKKKAIWFSVAFLIVILCVTYLPKMNQLGFYTDDWYEVYGGEKYGPQRFYDIYESDRPFRGVLQSTLFALFDSQIMSYQILALVVRGLGAIGLFWTLVLVWKKKYWIHAIVSGLYLIYPGFLEQPHAMDYQTQQFAMTFMIFSIGLSVMVVQSGPIWKKALFFFLSMGLSLMTYLLMEYYIGMEGYRFFILGYLFSKRYQGKLLERAKSIILRLLPFSLSAVMFFIWRVFIFTSTRYTTSVGRMVLNYLQTPFLSTFKLFQRWFMDIGDIFFAAWVVPGYEMLPGLRVSEFITAMVLGLSCVIAFVALLRSIRGTMNDDHEGSDKGWLAEMAVIGFFGAIICLIPINLGERDVSYIILNRFSFPSSIGVCLSLVGVIFFLIERPWKYGFIGLVIFSSVMTQYANTTRYANDWAQTRDFWTQFIWRAPSLAETTTLTGFHQGSIQEGYNIWMPANLIYYSQAPGVVLSGEVLNAETARNIALNAPFERSHRSFFFKHFYDMTLVFTKPTSNHCVRLMDNQQIEISIYDDPLIQITAPYSRTDLILMNDTVDHQMVEKIFGSIDTPEDNWCYYYEKAALARQAGDWQAVVELGNEAAQRGLNPSDAIEWMPFVQAYVYTQDFDTAAQGISALSGTEFYREQACQIFSDKVSQQEENAAGNEYLVNAFCETAP